MPVGPHILCPDATIQSTSRLRTSTGMCGTDWHASSKILAPGACFARISATRATSSSHPSTLLTCAVAMSFTLPLFQHNLELVEVDAALVRP